MSPLDEAVLRNMGDEALNIDLLVFGRTGRQTFAPAFRKELSYDPRILRGEHVCERRDS